MRRGRWPATAAEASGGSAGQTLASVLVLMACYSIWSRSNNAALRCCLLAQGHCPLLAPALASTTRCVHAAVLRACTLQYLRHGNILEDTSSK